jgi:hypothetical protein
LSTPDGPVFSAASSSAHSALRRPSTGSGSVLSSGIADNRPGGYRRFGREKARSPGGAETFAAGDRLAIINEDPADATLADLSITFLGKRT